MIPTDAELIEIVELLGFDPTTISKKSNKIERCRRNYITLKNI